MTNSNEIRTLKTLAKRYARANRLEQHKALDLVARQLGFSSWVALMGANKKDWLPSPKDLGKIEDLVGNSFPPHQIREVDPSAMNQRLDDIEHEVGEIGEHTYRLMDALDDVYMSGEGWSIHVPEAPNTVPVVEIAENSPDSNPIHNTEFLQEALRIANKRAQQVRARTSTDWPRRSTKPDAEGNVQHPLGRGQSNQWFCLHCNGVITGPQIAENLWHCPGCGASPLDIFDTAFWLGQNDERPTPVRVSKTGQTKGPEVKTVNNTLKLELNEANISLLIRSALVEDATNSSERLGALLAEISVDEDNDVAIAFDDNLWPEDKKPVQALAVAELLGIELDQAMIWRPVPFAWPGLGEFTSSTQEYTRMILEAYAQHGSEQNTE